MGGAVRLPLIGRLGLWILLALLLVVAMGRMVRSCGQRLRPASESGTIGGGIEDRLHQAQQALQAQRGQLEELQRTNETLTKRLEEANLEISRLQTILAQAPTQAVQGPPQPMATDAPQAKSPSPVPSAEADTLKKTLKEKEQTIRRLSSDLELAHREQSKLRQQNAQLEKKMIEVQRSYEVLEREVKALRASDAQAERRLKAQQKESVQQLVRLQKALADSEEAQQRLKKQLEEVDSLKRENIRLRKELDAANDRIAKLMVSLAIQEELVTQMGAGGKSGENQR